MIKAVFFDWFNTLAHYQPSREELEGQVLQELGFSVSDRVVSRGLYLGDKNYYEENTRLPIRQRSPDEQKQVYVNYQRIVLKEAGITPTDEILQTLAKRMRQLDGNTSFVLFDDVEVTLQALKNKKLIIGLLSNLQTEINTMCRELDITPYIDFTVTSGDVGADKPHPPIFLRALEMAKVKPAEAIHVGDQYQNDCLGARGVGINPVLLDRGDLFSEIKDCPRIRTLTEVTGLL